MTVFIQAYQGQLLATCWMAGHYQLSKRYLMLLPITIEVKHFVKTPEVISGQSCACWYLIVWIPMLKIPCSTLVFFLCVAYIVVEKKFTWTFDFVPLWPLWMIFGKCFLKAWFQCLGLKKYLMLLTSKVPFHKKPLWYFHNMLVSCLHIY